MIFVVAYLLSIQYLSNNITSLVDTQVITVENAIFVSAKYMAYNVILCYLKRYFFIAVLLFSPSVPTYLLERHYYMWKEEEIAESEEKEKEAKKLREMKMMMWHETASSAESSNVCIFVSNIHRCTTI